VYPSYSVIFFTTASGAGYGLLALVGLLAPFGAAPQDWRFALVSLGLALGGITFGLLSSLFHLGRPERAWRALSQWRSSWLSREGVAAVVTYAPAALFAGAWIFFGSLSATLGVLTAIGAAVTVFCTAMIYRSLKPIPRWHNRWVVPNYFAMALMTGALWLAFVAQFFGHWPALTGIAIAAIAVAAGLKLAYWRSTDEVGTSTAGSATGLGALGAVRLFEAPHTSENYLLKEMGFKVARTHAAKLRRIALALGFVVPGLLALLSLASSGWLALAPMLLAAPLATIGILAERWLFFAEARHTVTLYYGAATI
jgi:sulfite dehydrogenase (quinone) subunit SoeC